MAAEESKPVRSKKRFDAVAGIVVACLFVLLVLWFISWASKHHWDTQSAPATPQPSYKLSVSDRQVVNPATVSFVATVVNTGSVAGDPSCRVAAADVSGNYNGQDWFDLGKTLQPGEKSSFSGILTITNEGAAYVTQWNGGCGS